MHLPPVRIQRTPPEGHTLREQELPQVRDTHGGSTLLKRIARRCAGNRGTRQEKVEESREKNPVRRRKDEGSGFIGWAGPGQRG